jgi:hypothetical protein
LAAGVVVASMSISGVAARETSDDPSNSTSSSGTGVAILYLHTQRERERETDQWIDQWIEGETDQWIDQWREGETDQWIDRWREGETDQWIDRWREGETDQWREGETDEWIDQWSEGETDREEERGTAHGVVWTLSAVVELLLHPNDANDVASHALALLFPPAVVRTTPVATVVHVHVHAVESGPRDGRASVAMNVVTPVVVRPVRSIRMHRLTWLWMRMSTWRTLWKTMWRREMTMWRRAMTIREARRLRLTPLRVQGRR